MSGGRGWAGALVVKRWGCACTGRSPDGTGEGPPAPALPCRLVVPRQRWIHPFQASRHRLPVPRTAAPPPLASPSSPPLLSQAVDHTVGQTPELPLEDQARRAGPARPPLLGDSAAWGNRVGCHPGNVQRYEPVAWNRPPCCCHDDAQSARIVAARRCLPTASASSLRSISAIDHSSAADRLGAVDPSCRRSS